MEPRKQTLSTLSILANLGISECYLEEAELSVLGENGLEVE